MQKSMRHLDVDLGNSRGGGGLYPVTRRPPTGVGGSLGLVTQSHLPCELLARLPRVALEWQGAETEEGPGPHRPLALTSQSPPPS